MPKATHAIVVERTEVYRMIVDTDDREKRYEAGNVERRAKLRVERFHGPVGEPGVEHLGTRWEIKTIARVEPEID